MIALLGLCAIVAATTIAVMFYSVATFQWSDAGDTRPRPRNAFIEVLWLSIPIAILVAAAAPSIGAMLASS